MGSSVFSLCRFAVWRSLLACLAAGCDSAPPETDSALPTGPPRIHFPQTELDLGEVPVSRDGRTAEFPFINRGLSPLTIDLLELGCTCLEADASQSPVAPAEEAAIRLRLRADRAGAKSAHVLVHSNDPQHPRVRLDVKWRAVAPIEFEPLSLDFGNVLPNSEVARTVRVRRRADLAEAADAPVIGWRSTGAALALINDDDPDAVTVRLKTEDERGEGRASVHARLDGGWREELTLPVQWTVRDVIEVTPARLSLGFGQPGEQRSVSLVVSCFAGDDLEVAGATLDPEFAGLAEAAIERSSPSIVVIRVAARLPDEPGEHFGELVVLCTSPEQRSIRVPLSAYVVHDEEASLQTIPTSPNSEPRRNK